jgi:hypothetical protein
MVRRSKYRGGLFNLSGTRRGKKPSVLLGLALRTVLCLCDFRSEKSIPAANITHHLLANA